MTYIIFYNKKVRTFKVDRFSYVVLYIVEGNNIDVISVFNVPTVGEVDRRQVQRFV